jgi:hypothetical protein
MLGMPPDLGEDFQSLVLLPIVKSVLDGKGDDLSFL